MPGRRILTIGMVLTAFSTRSARANDNDADADRSAGESAGPAIVAIDDIVYGRVHGAGLLADIAYPESKAPLPAIISVHGGRWRGGHKRDGSTIVVKQWAGFGFFSMSIDYRLVGCSPAPACYQDLQCAIRFVPEVRYARYTQRDAPSPRRVGRRGASDHHADPGT